MNTQAITPEEIDKFTIENRREIIFYLRQLINDGDRISVVFNEGQGNILTLLLDVQDEEDALVFDWGGNNESNQKLLESGRALFVASPHGVKNQFAASGVRKTTFKGRPAFETHIPKNYTRLQRREYFRLVLPLTRRPPCTIPLENGKSLQLPVVDLSIGGIGLELPENAPDFEIGQELPRVRIELKGVGNIDVGIEVRNRITIERANKTTRRMGCQFTKVSNALENHLQRFITDVQREERARLGT